MLVLDRVIIRIMPIREKANRLKFLKQWLKNKCFKFKPGKHRETIKVVSVDLIPISRHS